MKKLLVIALIVTGSFITACGGSGSDVDPTTASTQAAVATPTETPVAEATATTASEVTSSTPVTAAAATPEPPGEDRILISAIGVDAPLRLQVVGTDGNMGGTDDSSLVEIYDFSGVEDIGGLPGQGNTIVSGNQREGSGSFTSLASISEGDSVTITYGGETFAYSAVILCEVSLQEITPILATGGHEMVTLIQAGGSGSQSRLYALAERNAGSIPRSCPAGEPQ